MKREVYEDGRLVERADDNTRIVETWDKDGNQLPDRPYTAAENYAADLRTAKNTRETNAAFLRGDMPQGNVDMLNVLNAINAFLNKTNDVINADFAANPAATLRPLAAGLRFGIKQVLRISKLQIGGEALDSPDTGS
jgi:hypothetical protein